MEAYITLAAGVILLPCIYWGAMAWYQPSFQEQKNRSRRILRSLPEAAAVLAAEAAFVRIWQQRGGCTASDMRFQLLYLMLAGMTFFCMTDYWERVVPNSMLLLLLCVFIVVLGLQGVRNADVLWKAVPSIVLGFVFCVISFGFGYLLSHGNMGVGDVKLVLVMGLYLTGEYVVGAVLYGCIAGALYSVLQLVRRKLSRKDEIPFVPFLYIGVLIKYIVG